MSNQENVINVMEHCIERMTTTGKCDYDCPYYHNPHGCKVVMLKDAISLIKAQAPRVMTLEEAKNADFCFCEIGTLFVCRIVFNPSDGWVTIQQFGKPDIRIDSNEYGISFRCWTFRPTEEQRKAVKWNE